MCIENVLDALNVDVNRDHLSLYLIWFQNCFLYFYRSSPIYGLTMIKIPSTQFRVHKSLPEFSSSIEIASTHAIYGKSRIQIPSGILQ